MCNILIAEDESRLAAFLEKGFRKHGLSSQVVSNGEQALQVTQLANYDVIVLDLGLPIKDGWQVLKELRSRGNPAQTVIVVTAQVDVEELVLKAGANDFIAKPFRFADLLHKVQSLIR
jgi:DNA-binding response OmpR family regulator